MPGELDTLRGAGFSDDEIAEYKQFSISNLRDAGFTDQEINKHLGIGEFNQSALDGVFNGMYAAEAEKNEDEDNRNLSFMESLNAGFQQSVTGLIARDKPPDVLLSEDASIADRITAQVATLAGDAPFMAVGALAGGAGGAALGAETGPGMVITGGIGTLGGAFALPAGMRRVILDSFENGSIDSFGEFWDRVKGTFVDTAKGWILGAATSAAGRFATATATSGVAKLGVGSTASKLIPQAADFTATVGTLGALGPALERQVPTKNDFIDAAVIIGGLKSVKPISRMVMDVYEMTGRKPYDIVIDAQTNLSIKEDLLAGQFPRAYRDMARAVEQKDPTARKALTIQEQLDAVDPIKVEAKLTVEPVAPETAVAEILSAVAIGKKGAKPEKFLSTFDALYKDYVDKLHPLRVLMKKIAQGEEIDVTSDFYKLARLDRGTAGKIVHFFEYGTFDFKTLRTTGDSLQSTLSKIPPGRLDHFRAYMLARRGLELEKRGIKLPESFSKKNMSSTVKELTGEFGESFESLVKFQDSVLKYLRDSGIVSADQFKVIKEANNDYVPFYRHFDSFRAAGEGKGLKVSNPIRRITGSELPIVDPIESIIKNTSMFITLAERNRIGTALGEFADVGEFVTTSKRKITKIDVSPREIKKALKSIEDELGIELPETSLTIFRSKAMQAGENEVIFFKEGKPVILEVPKEVAAVFKGLDQETMNLFVRIASIPAKTLRAGAVLDPAFTVRNAIRDTFNATLFSTGGFRPIIDTFRGLHSVVGKDEFYKLQLKSGAFNAVLAGLDRKYVKESMHTMLQDQGRVHNMVHNPLGMLRILSEVVEDSPRVGEIRRLIQDPKTATVKEILDAGFSSREVTLDFARMGANVRAINMISAFFNAQLQGADRIARGFKDKPVQSTSKAIAAMTIPSMLLHLTHYDWDAEGGPKLSDWYTEVPEWQRELYWVIRTGAGDDYNVWRIPKPFEAGIFFATGAELMMDKVILDDPVGFESMYVALMKSVIPNPIPTVVAPFVETHFNESLFTGNPIIPARLEKLLPEYQSTPHTSELAKFISQSIAQMPNLSETQAASPIVIETFIRDWSGGLGQHAINLTESSLRALGVLPELIRPADTMADMPIIRSFTIRHPSMSTQIVSDFYEAFEKNSRVFATIEALAVQGRSVDALREWNKRKGTLIDLEVFRDAMSQATHAVRLIESHPTMPREEKRELIDRLYTRINQTAKQGLELIRRQEEALAEVNK